MNGLFLQVQMVQESFKIFFKAFSDIRSFGPMRIACVGEATAQVVRSFNLEVELIPEKSTAEDLAKELVATESLDSANVLVIVGNRNRDVLVSLLESVGHAIVDTLPIYQTDFADVNDSPDRHDFVVNGADAVVFASSSSALSFVEQEDDLCLEKDAKRPIFCSMGPQTSQTLKENDLTVDLEAGSSSLESMVDALVNFYS